MAEERVRYVKPHPVDVFEAFREQGRRVGEHGEPMGLLVRELDDLPLDDSPVGDVALVCAWHATSFVV
jgi:hypothetical protein